VPEVTLCPKCQAQVQPDWPYCSHCGSRLDRTPPPPPTIPTCVNCGATLDTSGAFCWKCGVPVATGRDPFIPDPGVPPPGAGWSGAPPARSTREGIYSAFGSVNRVALSSVNLAVTLGLVGVVLTFTLLFIAPGLPITNITVVSSGTSFSLDLTGLYLLAGVGLGGVVFTLLELWFFRKAFRTLARQDQKFSTPATLVFVAFVAVLIIVGAAMGTFVLLYQSVLCAGSGHVITSTCFDAGTIFALAGVFLLGAVVLLVGYIGLVIGVWRLGTRYGEGMFKIGAILLIIPFLNIVGSVFILVAARSASAKARSGSSSIQPA